MFQRKNGKLVGGGAAHVEDAADRRRLTAGCSGCGGYLSLPERNKGIEKASRSRREAFCRNPGNYAVLPRRPATARKMASRITAPTNATTNSTTKLVTAMLKRTPA